MKTRIPASGGWPVTLDGFGSLTDLKGEIDASLLVHLETTPVCSSLRKPGRFCGHGVIARRKVAEHIIAALPLTVLCEMVVSTLVAVTVASGTAAPEASRTFPLNSALKYLRRALRAHEQDCPGKTKRLCQPNQILFSLFFEHGSRLLKSCAETYITAH